MTGTRLHWVKGPWPGKIAMAARPRGGEWLEDEADYWRSQHIATVVSLLERHEELELNLDGESAAVRDGGMRFRSFPIADRQVPASESAATQMIEELDAELAAGRNVVLHCRQGVGRTGLMAVSLLIGRGIDPDAAIERVSEARGIPVPETAEQRDWIERFAVTLAPAR